MGGTTAKVCLIEDGEPLIAAHFEVDRKYRFKKGSGLPVKVPVIEMIEIGAGGGSIARIDGLGLLTVGPDSAGAEPGPACYGRGGSEPTVTDADLVLGYLDPAFFLGGQMRLDRDAAARAIEARIGRTLGLDAVRAAWGIHQLVNENMARRRASMRSSAARTSPSFRCSRSAAPGRCTRTASRRILRCPRVVYPLAAGVMSAIGFLCAPLAFDFVRSLPGRLEAMDWTAVNAALAEMEQRGRAGPAAVRAARNASPFAGSATSATGARATRSGSRCRPASWARTAGRRSGDAFEQAYGAIYGHVLPELEIDVVSWRVVAEGPRPELRAPTAAAASPGGEL